jgi:hypothetical protein
MLKTFALLSALAFALPASASTCHIVNPGEEMVTVPGLEHIGPSRVSTVRFCAGQAGVDNWRDLITDYEYETMEACLIEHT